MTKPAVPEAQLEYDAFISYANADAEWVHPLAENLHAAGLSVFLDEWEIGPGDSLVARLDHGLAQSRAGVLVLSPMWLERPWVQQEYRALMVRFVNKKTRLIPVLYQDITLPPLLADIVFTDFRHAQGEAYQRQFERLLRALRGERPGPPVRRPGLAAGASVQPASRPGMPEGHSALPGQSLVVPKSAAVQVSGTHRLTLRISLDRVELAGEGEASLLDGRASVEHTPTALTDQDRTVIRELWDAYHRGVPEGTEHHRKPGSAAALHLEDKLRAAGAVMTRAFLGGAAGDALRLAIERTAQSGSVLELGLEVAPGLEHRPWEALLVPGQDHHLAGYLSLHPSVRLFRSRGGATPLIHSIPGPLRILVAIGSPEAQNARGELLDMELELGMVLDAVDDARKNGQAFVRILEFGTLEAIQRELQRERYHVLHISCHAGPGGLILETSNGSERKVTAAELCSALPAGRSVPLVVLAGCLTALAGATEGGPVAAKGKPALPSLAMELLGHGVPAVLAMQAPVGDRYASLLASHLYQALASHQGTDPLAALSYARHAVEEQRKEELREREARRSSRSEDLAQWATPALYLRGAPHPLFLSGEPFEELATPPEPDHDPGVVVRRVGDFVGRRQVLREERAWLQGRDGSALVLHGMGGVGKSTLAAEMARFFSEQGWVVASLSGEVDGETLLQTVASRVRMALLAGSVRTQSNPEPLLQHFENRELTWIQRLDGLRALGLPVLLLLDNFEDNLSLGQELRNEAELGAAQGDSREASTAAGPAASGAGASGGRPQHGSRVMPEALEELLAAWVERPGATRLLFTSRYPFELPLGASRGANHRLRRHHLGPLTQAETRKLLWRLEALDRLSLAEQRRAYAEVGGHPRALEYLDALLRQGRARFPDVEARLLADLKKKHGIDDPARWCSTHTTSFDGAQAEVIALAAQDVLLPELLARLSDAPLAKCLLIGAAVYRHPVEPKALWWQLTETQGSQLTETQGSQVTETREPTPDAATTGIPPAPDLANLEAPEGFASSRARLEALSLLCPVPGEPPEPARLFVHRWTAAALRCLEPEAGGTPAEWTEAHARAAEYYRWRVNHRPQPKAQDVEDLLEARFHYHACGHLTAAVESTLRACSQLDIWGAWQREQDLLLESLGWVPEGSRDAAVFQHYLGNVVQERGDYDRALDWHNKSLAIKEELGDRLGVASSYGQLGILAQLRGDHDRALDWYNKSLAIDEELGNRAGMATSYHQLGIVAYLRGDYDCALVWCNKSLAIKEELGNRAGIASSYHNLGIVAQERGDYDRALDWYNKSLAIEEELGNRSGMASSYNQLGIAAQECGDYDRALDWYHKALAINEDLGNRPGMARSYHNLGIVAQDRGDYDRALEWYHKALAIFEERGDRLSMASSYNQLGIVAQDRGDYDRALEWYHKALAIKEELGNRSGMASSYGQLGAVLTEQGQVEEAIPLNLRSLAIHQELGVPQVSIDLCWLGRQREALGEARFNAVLAKHLDAESVKRVLELLERAGGARGASETGATASTGEGQACKRPSLLARIRRALGW